MVRRVDFCKHNGEIDHHVCYDMFNDRKVPTKYIVQICPYCHKAIHKQAKRTFSDVTIRDMRCSKNNNHSNHRLRLVDDLFWADEYISDLDTDGKCLYEYCIHNPQQKPHGIFVVSIEQISLHTGIKVEKVKMLLQKFNDAGKIKWMPEQKKIWTKKFLLIQMKNPAWFKGVIKALKTERSDLAKEYVKYYNDLGFWKEHGVDTSEIVKETK